MLFFIAKGAKYAEIFYWENNNCLIVFFLHDTHFLQIPKLSINCSVRILFLAGNLDLINSLMKLSEIINK